MFGFSVSYPGREGQGLLLNVFTLELFIYVLNHKQKIAIMIFLRTYALEIDHV